MTGSKQPIGPAPEAKVITMVMGLVALPIGRSIKVTPTAARFVKVVTPLIFTFTTQVPEPPKSRAGIRIIKPASGGTYILTNEIASPGVLKKTGGEPPKLNIAPLINVPITNGILRGSVKKLLGTNS